MFSVSGWSVTAPLQTQKEVNNNPNAKQAPQNGNGGEAGKAAKSKKRKRGGADKVTEDTVSSMWETHIEGRPAKTVKKDEKGRPLKSTKSDNRVYAKQKKEPAGDDVAKEEAGDAAQESVKTELPFAKKDKKDKKKKKNTKGNKDAQSSESAQLPSASKAIATKTPSDPSAPKLTPLQASMRAKLSSARFRHLNEQLYTSPSTTSLDLFTATPALFDEYHAGFRQQVAVWPENPVDGYVKEVIVRGKVRRPPRSDKKQREAGGAIEEEEAGNFAPSSTPGTWATHMTFPLPRTNGTCTIADLGCGDAALSASLQKHAKKLNVRVLSFDLHSPSPLVTRADIASLPLPDGGVDVAVFCLALMGTNWPDFIDEAWRVLRWRGELWIAEIKSRFERPVEKKAPGGGGGGGGVHKTHTSYIGKKRAPREDDDDANEGDVTVEIDPHAPAASTAASLASVRPFAAALQKRGFVLAGAGEREAVDASNKMFVKLRFFKGARPERGRNVGAEIDKSAVGGERFEKSKRFGNRNVTGPTGANGEAVGKRQKKRFIDKVDDREDLASEEKLLKPCVYKPR